MNPTKQTEAPSRKGYIVTDRKWIVASTARSAARLHEGQVINMIASPESTIRVCGLRIRNHFSRDASGTIFISGLTVEAGGTCRDEEEAVELLGHMALAYFRVVALAANAAIDHPEDLLVYAPPVDGAAGRFVSQRSVDRRSPAASLRAVKAEDLLALVQVLQSHLEEDRLHRAMAHYLSALSHIYPLNHVLAAESLFMACENLAPVILRRLLRDADLPDTPGGKHDLALVRGFLPRSTKPSEHLNELDSWVRLQHIFEGDEKCYKRLKSASDHFEHGSRHFGVVKEDAESSAEPAFAYVRRAILRELGLSPDSGLFGARFDKPLGDWRPSLELRGTYTESATPQGPGLTPESISDDWPQFLGLNLFPQITAIEDLPSGERNISLTAAGNGNSLLPGQSVITKETTWLLPSTPQHQMTQIGDLSIVVKKAGKDG